MQPPCPNDKPETIARHFSPSSRDAEINRLSGAIEDVKNIKEPWISVYARLQASGVSDEECAELLGKPYETLRVVASSPRFQSLLINYAKTSGHDSALEVLRAQAMPCLVELIALRNSHNTSPSIKVSICNSLLDRIYGKAPQVVKQAGRAPDDLSNLGDDPADVARALDGKIRRLQNGLNVLPKPVVS